MSSQLGKYVSCDATKCTGCKACEMACFKEHNEKSNNIGYTVGTVTVPVTPKLYVTRVSAQICAPVQCKHCEDAPCMNVCSKEAISRIDGQVIVDINKCIGCKDCMLACPFGAIDLLNVSEDGRVKTQAGCDLAQKAASKCDLCKDNPNGPACVRVCPNEALKVVDPALEKIDKNRKAVIAMVEKQE